MAKPQRNFSAAALSLIGIIVVIPTVPVLIVIGIALISVIIKIIPICMIVGIMLVGIIIELLLRVGMTRYTMSLTHKLPPIQADIYRIHPTCPLLFLPEIAVHLLSKLRICRPFPGWLFCCIL